MWLLVLLAIVWVVALAPMVLRKVREREAVTSVTSFNSQLLRLSGAQGRSERTSSVPGAAIGFSAAAQRLHEERYGADFSEGAAPLLDVDAVPTVSRVTSMRRRRVLTCLVAGTVVSFLVGFAAPVFDDLAIFGLVATAAYVALLIYFQRIAIERAQKVVALETRRGVAIALDQARHTCGAPVVQPRSSLRGNGWSVAEPGTSGVHADERQLVSAGH